MHQHFDCQENREYYKTSESSYRHFTSWYPVCTKAKYLSNLLLEISEKSMNDLKNAHKTEAGSSIFRLTESSFLTCMNKTSWSET